jgi:hypothetical protein
MANRGPSTLYTPAQMLQSSYAPPSPGSQPNYEIGGPSSTPPRVPTIAVQQVLSLYDLFFKIHTFLFSPVYQLKIMTRDTSIQMVETLLEDHPLLLVVNIFAA